MKRGWIYLSEFQTEKQNLLVVKKIPKCLKLTELQK